MENEKKRKFIRQTTWTTTKGYLPGNIQKSSSYLSAGQGIPPYPERSAGEFEVVG